MCQCVVSSLPKRQRALGQSAKRFTRMTEGLWRLGLRTLDERRNRCDLIEVFRVFNCYTDIDIRVLFTLDGKDNGLPVRRHSKKICKVRFNTDIMKYFFLKSSHRQMEHLYQDTVDAPSLNCFKNRLNKTRSTRMGFFMTSPLNPRPCHVG